VATETDISTSEELCSHFSHTFSQFDDSFTYFALATKTKVFLNQTTVARVENAGNITQETVVKMLYEQDPLTCTFGTQNPGFVLSKESFCSQIVSSALVAEVKAELASSQSQSSGDTETGKRELVLELEADLTMFGRTHGKVGSLLIYHDIESTNSKQIIMNLDEAFIDSEAIQGDLCSLRLTEFGDMRSFVGSGSKPNSHGASEEMVDHFDCIAAGTLVNAVRNYTLTKRQTFAKLQAEKLIGRGLLLKNINRDVTLTFGIISLVDDIQIANQVAGDITALCQHADRYSMLLFTDYDLTEKTLYAYYQPTTKQLLTWLKTTSLYVKIEDFEGKWVTNTTIATNSRLCSSFSLQYDDDVSPTLAKAAIGKRVKSHLRYSYAVNVTNTSTGALTV